jgi:hypothetical protein
MSSGILPHYNSAKIHVRLKLPSSVLELICRSFWDPLHICVIYSASFTQWPVLLNLPFPIFLDCQEKCLFFKVYFRNWSVSLTNADRRITTFKQTFKVDFHESWLKPLNSKETETIIPRHIWSLSCSLVKNLLEIVFNVFEWWEQGLDLIIVQ